MQARREPAPSCQPGSPWKQLTVSEADTRKQSARDDGEKKFTGGERRQQYAQKLSATFCLFAALSLRLISAKLLLGVLRMTGESRGPTQRMSRFSQAHRAMPGDGPIEGVLHRADVNDAPRPGRWQEP